MRTISSKRGVIQPAGRPQNQDLFGAAQMMISLETAAALADKSATWQGSTDMDSLYVLGASLLMALIAFVILMRARF